MSRFPMILAMVRFALILAVAPPVWSQVGVGKDLLPTLTGGYPSDWPPGPSRLSVPDWTKPGRIRFSRWDGGPIETAKAFLSGWPGFNPPRPDYVYEMTNWYDSRTIRLLREANINLIWVTFSNGFSIPTEGVQREQLRTYIDECHRQGIHVMAYESIANIFWEDMYKYVPESRSWVAVGSDGKPVPYGAGDYTKMGRVTRYMADLSGPGWRKYLKNRIDLAIDAGADGIMYDNCFSSYIGDTLTDLYQYAASRKKGFLLMANLHRSDFIFNRLLNCITTEEGGEAGLFSEANVSNSRWNEERDTMLRLEGGLLANNIGRMRVFSNLSEGWKPVMIESRQREVGVAETHVMSAARQQLVTAENLMFGIANELFIEGAFAHGLWNQDPETLSIWQAIGRYNRFSRENEDYYVDVRSAATLAVILDNRSEGIGLLNGLSARDVIYDVLYEHELTPERLKRYSAVALLTAQTVRDRALSALQAYVRGGGRLFAATDAAQLDERGRSRLQPPFFKTETAPTCIYREKLPSLDDLAATLKHLGRPGPVRVEAPKGVLYNVVVQPRTGRMIVHLLNYLPHRADKIRVSVEGRYGAVKLLSPDGVAERVRTLTATGASTELEIPQLNIYSLIVLEPLRSRNSHGD